MRLARPIPRRRAEATIALINVVFLLLIFFLVAGSLTPPLDGDVDLAETQSAEASPPPDAVTARLDGRLYFHGSETTAALYLEARKSLDTEAEEGAVPIKLVADRNLPATQLLAILTEFRRLGAGQVLVITRRAGS